MQFSCNAHPLITTCLIIDLYHLLLYHYRHFIQGADWQDLLYERALL